jgi:hypothetical protein
MRLALLLLLGAVSLPALAQEEDDEAALALADRTLTEPTVRRACIEYAELSAIDTTHSDGSATSTGGRGSFNLRCDGALASGSRWRGVFSDRFDKFWAHGSSARSVNTLKEAYLTYRYDGNVILDMGRINIRQGVAFAYNPTDYFRANAVRAIISIDPETLRDERMGTLMGRVQTLWASGSLTGIFAPQVGAKPNNSSFNPDLGATNGSNRWLLVWSQRLAPRFQPQLSLTGSQHESPRAGVDLTYLANQATVAYLEWSGTRSASNLSRSGYTPVPALSSDKSFRSRLSAGFTYTTSYKLSFTLEYQYDEAAPGDREWTLVRSGPVAPYVRYREYVGAEGELPTRQNVFLYAHWDDVGIARLGLTGFVRFDPYDHSRVSWMEARYHWNHAGIALQWQRNAGDATSDLAPWPVRQTWLALVDYYF